MDSNVWDERYAGDDLVWSAEPNRFLVAEVDTLPPGRALDLACGEGRNAVWLAERGLGRDRRRLLERRPRQSTSARRGARRVGALGARRRHRVHAGARELRPRDRHVSASPRSSARVAFRHAAAAVAIGGTLLVVGHDITNRSVGWGGPSDAAVLYGPEDVVADLDDLETVKAERAQRRCPRTTERRSRSTFSCGPRVRRRAGHDRRRP